MKLTLRPYQVEALAKIEAAEARGVRRQLGVAATGAGKTCMFVALAERRRGRTLILAHRDELIEQAATKVREIWPDADVGIVKGPRNEWRSQVVVASVQTLARPNRLEQVPTVLSDPGFSLLAPPAPFDLVVCDEAHHARADSYMRIFAHLGAGNPGPCTECLVEGHHARPATPEEVDDGHELGVAFDVCPPRGPLLLGVTATPDRGDGKGLDDVFDEIVFSYDILWCIRAGYLCDLRGLRVQLDQLDLSAVKVSGGDYQAGSAGRALEDAGAPELIVAAWLEHALGRRTLVFTPTVALAAEVQAEFQAAGVRAGMVSGETPLDERRATLAAYSRGDLDVIANVGVLSEGYDEPRTDCIVVARPTKSRALYAQIIGRGCRKHPDKTDCLILDVVGATGAHSLVTIPSLFGVEDQERVWTGGVSLVEQVEHEEQQAIASGRLLAEEVELFAQLRVGAAWVATHSPGAPRRYVCSLGPDRPIVELRQLDAGDRYEATLLPPRAQQAAPVAPLVLVTDVTLETAQGVGEDFARKHGIGALVDPEAPWRKRRPTAKQLAAAGKWRLPGIDGYATAGELSDALTAHIERKKAGRR